jgi:hypothetical protein
MRLERFHFPSGSLTLICQSTLPGIANSKVLTAIEIATLAANNERLAQEPPKSGSGSNASYPTLICWMTVVIRVICRNRFPRVYCRPERCSIDDTESPRRQHPSHAN